MVGRDTTPGPRKCPDCGNKLAIERDLFHCKEHGAFFTYGPQLLVRAPRQSTRLPDVLLPWENHPIRRS